MVSAFLHKFIGYDVESMIFVCIIQPATARNIYPQSVAVNTVMATLNDKCKGGNLSFMKLLLIITIALLECFFLREE